MSEISFTYEKQRKEFGCPYKFEDDDFMNVDIGPDPELLESVRIIETVEKSSGINKEMAEHEINTTRADYIESSMNHTEGGWPKDLNFVDSEQTLRFRKKIEKDEMYTHAILQLLLPMEHCVHQNNAINIYEQYFEDCEESDSVEEQSFRTVNVFRDPPGPGGRRPVSHISWSPDGGSRLAVSHSQLDFQKEATVAEGHHNSYIWHVGVFLVFTTDGQSKKSRSATNALYFGGYCENPNRPQMKIDAGGVPIVSLEYNPRDLNTLAGGLYNGLVTFWDVRRGGQPIEFSDHYHSFRDPVTCILWINSKSGLEFFSSSTDGQVKWWDVRKIKEPTETLLLDITKGEEQSLSRALGASALEYENTIPTRFMVGTEMGVVVCGNRKGKTPAEKLGVQYKAHHGPIWSLQRNPAFLKNFLTIGDWTARIWSEDCRESSIIWTSYQKKKLTKGAWSPTKPSVFFTTRVDGTLDVWDILQRQRDSSLSIKICDEALHGLRCHESGEILAVGNDIGTTYIIEISDKFVKSTKNDKAYLTAMFERESRREKIIEGKLREQRLKMRTKQDVNAPKPNSQTNPHQQQQLVIENITKEFFNQIKDEGEIEILENGK